LIPSGRRKPRATASTGRRSFSSRLGIAVLVTAAAWGPAARALDDSVREVGATPHFWKRHGAKFEGDAGIASVIGIVWTGFDIRHPDLMDGAGHTRILAIWDQCQSTGRPSSFGYGSEWTSEDVDGRRAVVPKNDKGTALAVLAAGSGRVTRKLTGVAPEAKLVLVRSTLDPWDIVDAVDYVFRVAARADYPAVVDLSLNTHLSSHDGTDSLDIRLDQLTGPGRIVVAAAGNEGGLGIHAEAVLRSGDAQSLPFDVGATWAHLQDLNKFRVFMVYPEADSVTIGLRDPAGARVFDVPKGSLSWSSGPLATLQLCNGSACDDNASFPGKTIAALELFGFGDEWPLPGVWTLEIEPVRASEGAELDAWMQLPDGGPSARFVNPDEAELVGWPACADSVISVGAYEPAPRWGDGRDMLWPSASPGPLRDGREAIDVVAPGYRIRVPKRNLEIDEWNGTSFAAAHVAGAVALLLSVRPASTPSEIRDELWRRAKPPSDPGPSPESWGHGKLWLGSAAK
jgi:subtilisin family serine protease